MEDLYNDYLKNLALSQSPKDKLSPTWKEMEQRLDKELPQKKDRRRGIIFWSVILLVLGGGAVYYWFSTPQTTPKSIGLAKKISTTQQEFKENITHQKTEPYTIDNTVKSNLNNKAVLMQNDLKKGKNSINKINLNKEKPLTKSSHAFTHNNGINKASLGLTDRLDNSKKLQNNPIQIHQSNVNESNEGQNTNPNTAINQTAKKEDKANNINNISDTILNMQEKVVDSLLLIPAKANAVKSVVASKSKVTWEIVPTLSADFLLSNVRVLSYPGFLAGVNVHYNMNSHWAFKGGLHFNHIRVNSNGDLFYYLPKKDVYSMNYSKIEDINGFIDALEVPFAVRYTVNPKSKFAIHFSTGLSTIFYLRTNCTYKLLVNNNYQYWNTKEDRDDEYGHTEWMNNLRLATGFSYLVGSGLRIEVEPSYKLPLEELGEGHSRIGAFSVNVSLRIPILKK